MLTARIKIFISLCIALTKSKQDLAMENIALRKQLIILKRKIRRPPITDSDRQFFTVISRLWRNWKTALIIVQPATVLKWHRELSRKFWAKKSKRKSGSKPLDRVIVAMIRRMAKENLTWGASRIHGELRKLGIEVSERTVAYYLPKDRPTSPTWNNFLKSHAKGIISLDLFTVFTSSFRMLYGLVIIDHARRKILLTNATYFPSQFWVTQQVLNALLGEHAYKHLIVDNDDRFSNYFSNEIATLLGIDVIKTSVGSPWQNAVVERVIGTLRRECLDHTIVLGEGHLRNLLAEFTDYYNNDRIHRSLSKETPLGRDEERPHPIKKSLVRKPRLNGLHSRYSWSNATSQKPA